MSLDWTISSVLREILGDYALSWKGDHGVAHWARVFENGRRLAELTGAEKSVVELFAIFHDCRREDELGDPEHGSRAAEYAESLRGRAFELPDREFGLLVRACEGHSDERTHPDATIQTCWDADRLDLGRVGITPHPDRLCTEAARSREILNWADARGAFGYVPELVEFEWGIDLDGECFCEY